MIIACRLSNFHNQSKILIIPFVFKIMYLTYMILFLIVYTCSLTMRNSLYIYIYIYGYCEEYCSR